MSDPFVHLHVASGYSLQYGASHPAALVTRAAEHGMDLLGLTDRNGVYGAVRFVKACQEAGIRPVLGADLAVTTGEPGARTPTPARGGSYLPEHCRVTVIAVGRPGWAGLCRLVSAAHRERGRPVTTMALLAEHAQDGQGGLIVLLGPSSDVGRQVAVGNRQGAAELLARWRAALGEQSLTIEVVHHRGPGDALRAGRMAALAQQGGLKAVLTNAVRYAERRDAVVADVLDAARRLVPLDRRHVDRANGEGYLKSGKEMALVAEEVGRYAGLPADGRELLVQGRLLAERAVLDPRGDLGLGEVHFPELDQGAGPADGVLRERCHAGLGRRAMSATTPVRARLDDELRVIAGLGYASYFLTVGDVATLIRSMGVRCAARGSGAGSLVTYLLGISEVDPMAHGLLMERFLSPLRRQLPDIDLDVESHRRTEVYERVLSRYGEHRCACVAMMETYRARHALRDVGAALGLPPGEIDAVAKAFPHIRASQIRTAVQDLPELRSGGLAGPRLNLLFALAERLDGLARHVALHPCGVLLSDASLLDRTPVERSLLGFSMSQFDKDDVEDLGLLKLDVLGVRMQSAMSHAVGEIERIDAERVDIDRIPRDDPATFRLIQSTRTLGCFQIESPGQRELVGKFAPDSFADLIIDISLFRPGPVQSDMVRPFLQARQGWERAAYPHPDLEPILRETEGVVVFHEQVLRIISCITGCSLAHADEARRALGDPEGHSEVRVWFYPAALRRGYPLPVVERVWEMLRSFGSFGFCKAHAAAFALPTYQSAWLKAHHPAAFLAGVLTHDPGMYPKRLLLDDARHFGIAILGLDVNLSDAQYRVERVGVLDEPAILGPADAGLPGGRRYGIRLALSDVSGISAAEITRILAGRPYGSLADFWHRAGPTRPVAERLVVAGGFDGLYGLGSPAPLRRRGQLTRRDLLLQVAELHRYSRPGRSRGRPAGGRTARGGRAAKEVGAQLALDFPGQDLPAGSGLPEMTDAERARAELEVLGMDATRHVVDFYRPFLAEIGATAARELLGCRNGAEVLVAGVKVATQTPPIRSGRRVVFITLDDGTGPIDATLFEDAQLDYAATVFHSWLLVIRGVTRRTGPRGISLRALRCWELPVLHRHWRAGGVAAVRTAMQDVADWSRAGESAVHGAAASRSTRPVLAAPAWRYTTGFRQSPYSDVRPSGADGRSAPRRLWHSSTGSAG